MPCSSNFIAGIMKIRHVYKKYMAEADSAIPVTQQIVVNKKQKKEKNNEQK